MIPPFHAPRRWSGFPSSRKWIAATLASVFLGVGLAPAGVVINEVHYAPSKDTGEPEFIELLNDSASAVDVSGWKFDAGIDYQFPSGSVIAAHGYRVVTADPPAFQAAFGATAGGPWTGKLSNNGERLRLRDAANTVVDDLTYGAGFPWPTAADGEGSSMELINPALDDSLPGSWRSSGQPVGSQAPQVYVPPIAPGWHYRKGVSEASSPVTAWRQPGFVENASWLVGQTSVGFGDSDDSTILTDMQRSYSSIYLRRTFSIAAGKIPEAVQLQVRVDDGCVVWINGVEVARFHVPDGPLAFNGTAEEHEADVTQFESVILDDAASFLVEGQNVIAIHALNATRNSSDFTIDAQLSEAPTVAAFNPTPGEKNSCFAVAVPPSVEAVAHSPQQPSSNQAVLVTAKVTDAAGIGSVSLSYQVVNPGSYIRKDDDAFATSWTSLPMHDDGLGGDVAAGDHAYSASIPASVQTHRRLVRYRVTASNTGGSSILVPYADDGSPNFAYFVYDGVPSWSGALNPGTTAVNTFPGALMQTLPTYQLIANSTDVSRSQYDGNYDGARMWGTLVYNGRVYDHVQFYNRGEASTYVSGKNKWRFRFNTARDFQAVDNWGRPYSETWDTLNLNACASPWAAVNRGMSGIDEALSMRLYELSGTSAPSTHFLHFRVIDDAAETATTQYSGGNPDGANGGDLWGLYLAVEQPDGSFLDERGLPDGNVYKIESNSGDKKHQGANQAFDASDWDAFRSASESGQDETWWRQNLDLAAYYDFQACNRLSGNVDLREGWNHLFFHNPDGHWTAMPWDLDMMFIAKKHWSGTIIQQNCLQVASLAVEYANRAREILDLMASDSAPSGGQIGQLIDEYAQMVNPTGQALTWADLDAAMWNKNPRTSGGDAQTNHYGNFFRTPYTDSRNGGTWVRTLPSADFEGLVKYLVDYTTNTFPSGQAWAVNNGNQLGYGYKFLESDAADPAIPNLPTIAYTGASGYPINDLRFTTSAFSDPQGAGTFAALQWRIAEISAPGIPLHDSTKPRVYEISDVWRSAEIAPFTAETRIPGDALKAGHTYRVRVREKDNTGRWSHWSAATQFVAAAASVAPFQQNLSLVQIMYNPPALTAAEVAAGFTDKQDFEFIELQNIGSSALDLSSIAFTAGIAFTFPTTTVLGAGAHLLVVKNVAAFNARYGSGKPVAGAYTGNLDNGGETLTLSYGSTVVWSFAYSDGSHPAAGQAIDPWPVDPDTNGYSLVRTNPASLADPNAADNWRTSRLPGGSPGVADTITYAKWALQYPGIGAKTDDFDQDSRANGSEYAFGSNPTVFDFPSPTAGAIQSFTVDAAAAPYGTITFRRQIGATDMNYAVEASSDLQTWLENAARKSSTPNGDGTATDVWRAPQPTTTAPATFLRVKATN